MFNLVMRSRPWEEGNATLALGRLFEYTDAALTRKFKDGDDPRLDKLARHPCLFMLEGSGDQLARVGTITRARIVRREVAIDFAFDPEVSPIPNHAIFARRGDFDIFEDFEFSRNHWAVKDVDLYRALLRIGRRTRQRPTVFNIEENERIEPQLVSAMMPFDAAFTPIYRSIRSAVEAAGLRCRRADDIWENPAIIQDVVSLIDRSRVVICDCTGRNPNVFYEAGIAHTLGREVILITQSRDDIPFDLRHLRYIPYLPNREGKATLRAALTARLQDVIGG